MFGNVLSAVILGVDTHKVMVEADISAGLPGFSIVGVSSAQGREAQERIRTALRNAGIHLPPRKITVNLAPAALKKTGAGFDLPVAAAVLCAAEYIPPDALRDILVIGELGLDGQVRRGNGKIDHAVFCLWKRWKLPHRGRGLGFLYLFDVPAGAVLPSEPGRAGGPAGKAAVCGRNEGCSHWSKSWKFWPTAPSMMWPAPPAAWSGPGGMAAWAAAAQPASAIPSPRTGAVFHC